MVTSVRSDEMDLSSDPNFKNLTQFTMTTVSSGRNQRDDEGDDVNYKSISSKDISSGSLSKPTEESPLLQKSIDVSSRSSSRSGTSSSHLQNTNLPRLLYLRRMIIAVVVILLVSIVLLNVFSLTLLPSLHRRRQHNLPQNQHPPVTFPPAFVWGTATSSYQIEGAVHDDGRGPTIWDNFCHTNNTTPPHIMDGSSGDIACDHYHRMIDDVHLMHSLKFQAYRFAIAWSRILPEGRQSSSSNASGINQDGLQFYNRLIDELLAYNITPWVTMHHWDLPSALDGGWLNESTIDAFVEYAQVLLDAFSDRVHHWITINEPWTIAVNGYGTGVHAPGHISDTEVYQVGHHLLLAHARTAQLFRRKFGSDPAQSGYWIGTANCGDYRYPRNSQSQQDQKAAERAMMFQWGWFVDPIVNGDYPSVMRQKLGDRLPSFTDTDRDQLLGSADFFGLNYYSSLLASDPDDLTPQYSGYWADMGVNLTNDSEWAQNDMGWNVVPDGLRLMLVWIARTYGNPLIYITENGSAEYEPDLASAVADFKRRKYFEQHVMACARAMDEEKVNLGGYFAWSLMDNFEWQFGYQRRFGICRVDFNSLERTPKSSATFLRDTIIANGRNLPRLGESTFSQRRLQGSPRDQRANQPSRRSLPHRVVVGYGSNPDAVRKAVKDGVNVVIWSFVDVRVRLDDSTAEARQRLELQQKYPGVRPSASLQTNLNLTTVRQVIKELDDTGYNHTVHLCSVGGWNGAHLDPRLTAIDWYRTFREEVGDLFHGIDWDLEGNDDLASTYNLFTIECLDKMGEISQMAQADGYIVGMAPPQSYLDLVEGTHRFSRLVNLTDSNRTWHSEFSYFGANVYAYLLDRYGEWIDTVFMQFYESYSRASMTIHTERISPVTYLERYLDSVDNGDLVGIVDFSDDPAIHLSPTEVRLPLSKLVLGLANGWADTCDDKTLYLRPVELDAAWRTFRLKGTMPRGVGFWTIDEEGSNGVYFASELSRILFGSQS